MVWDKSLLKLNVGMCTYDICQCFDTDGWVAGRTSSPQKISSKRGSLLKKLEERPQGEMTDPGA